MTKRNPNKSYELPKRLLCTLLVLIVFVIGRNIMVYGVDVSNLEAQQDITSLLMNMISGDRYRCSLFALGISPYITSSILLALVLVFFPKDIKKRITKQKTETLTIVFTFILSIFYAYSRSKELTYVSNNSYFNEFGLQLIAIISFVVGAMIIVAILNVNKAHGIGQQLPIIIFNIIEGLYTTISGNYDSISYEIVLICAAVVVISVLMENIELQIPIQRVSIDNEYASKNYIAFKLNPIGIMPIMFSTSIFILIKYLLYFIGELIPNNQTLLWINVHMNMTDRFGIWVYLGVIVLFTLVFSFIMLSPDDLARNLQRAGDSVVDVYAGKATLRYFRFALFVLSIVSGVIMASCMSISLFMALDTGLNQQVAMLPSSFMMLVSMFSGLFNEIDGYYKFDSYKFFI